MIIRGTNMFRRGPLPPIRSSSTLLCSLCPLCVLSPALAQERNFNLLPPSAATGAHTVDHIFWALMVFSIGIVALVAWLVIWSAIRYRAGSPADRSHRTLRVRAWEIGWISLFTILGVADFIWASVAYLDLTAPPKDARTIYAVGKQWMWKIEHTSGRREINELHVPAGEPVRMVMSSQDVIHSFFLPAFRIKQDVLPDRYTSLWFQATEPGEYPLYCAEYCGTDHSAMRGRIVVMKPGDFQRWVSSQSDEPAVRGTPGAPEGEMSLRGRGAFYQLGCDACHIRTDSVRAPRLDGLWGRYSKMDSGELVPVDEQYIRESILRPNAKIVAGYASPSLMPTYQGRITHDQLNELVEFIRSLEHGWPEDHPDHAAPTPVITPHEEGHQ